MAKIIWRKSSSSYSNGQCAWVAPDPSGNGALVRDEHGGILALRPLAWRGLLRQVKAQ